MNLRPPVPTSDNLPKDEAKKQHRAALIPVAIGLIIVLGLAGYSALIPASKITIRPYITNDMSSVELLDQHEPDASMPLGNNLNFQPPANVDDVLVLRHDETSLSTEPANLPPPQKGRRIAGFTRSQNYLEDEYAFWEIPDTNIQNILSFYQKAAETINFQIVSDRPQAAGDSNATAPVSRTMIFTRQRRPEMEEGKTLPPANDVLVVRAKTLPEGHVHLTLWYRYALTHNR